MNLNMKMTACVCCAWLLGFVAFTFPGVGYVVGLVGMAALGGVVARIASDYE